MFNFNSASDRITKEFIRLAAIESNTKKMPLLNFQFLVWSEGLLDCFVGRKKKRSNKFKLSIAAAVRLKCIALKYQVKWCSNTIYRNAHETVNNGVDSVLVSRITQQHGSLKTIWSFQFYLFVHIIYSRNRRQRMRLDRSMPWKRSEQ